MVSFLCSEQGCSLESKPLCTANGAYQFEFQARDGQLWSWRATVSACLHPQSLIRGSFRLGIPVVCSLWVTSGFTGPVGPVWSWGLGCRASCCCHSACPADTQDVQAFVPSLHYTRVRLGTRYGWGLRVSCWRSLVSVVRQHGDLVEG